MLSLLHLRSSVATASSSAQCAASALVPRDLPAVCMASSTPFVAIAGACATSTSTSTHGASRSTCPSCFQPEISKWISQHGHHRTTTSGIKGDDGTLANEADNGEGDGRAGADDGGGDKHTRKKIVLLCGEGPPGELSDDEEFARLEAEQLQNYNHDYPDEKL